jgi:hypothetical protein
MNKPCVTLAVMRAMHAPVSPRPYLYEYTAHQCFPVCRNIKNLAPPRLCGAFVPDPQVRCWRYDRVHHACQNRLSASLSPFPRRHTQLCRRCRCPSFAGPCTARVLRRNPTKKMRARSSMLSLTSLAVCAILLTQSRCAATLMLARAP